MKNEKITTKENKNLKYDQSETKKTDRMNKIRSVKV